MASRQRLPELEPISPELVLVSPPEVAQRAREELREPSVRYDTTLVGRERPSEPPPRAVREPPPLPPRRRRGRIALVCAATAAVAAAIAYVVLSHDDNSRRVDPAAATASRRQAPSPKPAAAKKAATAAPHEQRRHAAKRVRHARRAAAKPPPTSKRIRSRSRTRSRKPKHAVASSPGFVPARTWTWPESTGARAYDTQFRLDGRVVLHVRTTRPRVVLPRTFRFHAGTYRWIVERVPAAANRRPVVDSQFVLTHATAARANN